MAFYGVSAEKCLSNPIESVISASIYKEICVEADNIDDALKIAKEYAGESFEIRAIRCESGSASRPRKPVIYRD